MLYYVLYHPDPGALHINPFTIPWENFYVFPPFAIRGKKLQKVVSDKNTGIVITPNQPTQPWYSFLLKLSIDAPLFINCSKDKPYQKSVTPSFQQNEPAEMSNIRGKFLDKIFLTESVDIIFRNRRPDTATKYSTHIKQ